MVTSNCRCRCGTTRSSVQTWYEAGGGQRIRRVLDGAAPPPGKRAIPCREKYEYEVTASPTSSATPTSSSKPSSNASLLEVPGVTSSKFSVDPQASRTIVMNRGSRPSPTTGPHTASLRPPLKSPETSNPCLLAQLHKKRAAVVWLSPLERCGQGAEGSTSAKLRRARNNHGECVCS